MRMSRKMLATVVAAAALLGGLQTRLTHAADTPPPTPAAAGKQIAFDRTKGNCLACHAIAGGETPGTLAPPLLGMAARYPDKAKLRAQIADPMAANPATSMPPFGRHGILTEAELDAVVEFVHGL